MSFNIKNGINHVRNTFTKHLKFKQGLKFEGFVDIDMVNKKNHVTRHYHNTITNAGKQLLIDKCAGYILSDSGCIHGQTYAVSSMLGKTSSYGGYKANSPDMSVCNVLLNIDPEKLSSLDGSATFLPIYKDDFAENCVVGYANINLIPEENGKEGFIDYSKSEYVADRYTVASRWKYPTGVASGTISAIAMMSRQSAINDRPTFKDGILCAKILDKVNVGYANYTSMSTAFCPPGISGITDNDSILLNFNIDGKSRWKYSISKGEISEVPDSDPFWVPFQRYMPSASYASVLFDYRVEGDYLYILGSYFNESYNSSPYSSLLLYVHKISTQALITTISLIASNSLYIANAKIITYNNNMYVTFGLDDELISRYADPGATGFKLTKSSDYYNNYTVVASMASELGITLPSGLNPRVVYFGNYGVNYIVGINGQDMIVSNLNNINQNIIDFGPPHFQYGTVRFPMPFSAGSNRGWICIGAPGYLNYNYGSNYVFFDCTDAYRQYRMNTDGTNLKVLTTLDVGIYLMMDGWYSKALSFITLPEPIQKGDNDEMYVSYGYKII